MTHYKRRNRKAYKGCCGMCACRYYDGGVRNKRLRSQQELRADFDLPIEEDLNSPTTGKLVQQEDEFSIWIDWEEDSDES